MDYGQIRQIRAVSFRNDPRENEAELNKLLAQGWRVLGLHTREYYGGLGPNDVRMLSIILGHTDEPPPIDPNATTYTDVLVEQNAAQARAYLGVGWTLISTLRASQVAENASNDRSYWYVLGKVDQVPESVVEN